MDPKAEAAISAIEAADVNGDGIDDLIVLTHAPYPSYVYVNPGNGDFSGVTPTEIGLGSSRDKGHATSAAVEDVNDDGIADIVIGNDGTSNMIYLGVPTDNPFTNAAGSGNFSGVAGLPFGSSNGPTTDVEVGDIDGDGALDIAVANDGTPNVIYWGKPHHAR